MSADLTAYLPLIIIALVVLVLAVWILARLNRKARIVDEVVGNSLFFSSTWAACGYRDRQR